MQRRDGRDPSAAQAVVDGNHSSAVMSESRVGGVGGSYYTAYTRMCHLTGTSAGHMALLTKIALNKMMNHSCVKHCSTHKENTKRGTNEEHYNDSGYVSQILTVIKIK